MSCGCQSASYWLSSSLGLSGRRFRTFWQPGAARVYHIESLTAWGCQGAHNGPCDSLGWQGGDFAFSASFLILNEIMRPGARSGARLEMCSGRGAVSCSILDHNWAMLVLLHWRVLSIQQTSNDAPHIRQIKTSGLLLDKALLLYGHFSIYTQCSI